MEDAAEWTRLDELNERATLLSNIEQMKKEPDWTPLAELRERAELLKRD